MRIWGKNQEMRFPRGPGKPGQPCFLWRLCPDPGGLQALIFGGRLKCNPAGHRCGLSNCHETAGRATGVVKVQMRVASSSQSPLCSQPPGRAAVRPRTRQLPRPPFPSLLGSLPGRDSTTTYSSRSLWSLEDPRSGVFPGDAEPLGGTGPTGRAVSVLFRFVLFCFITSQAACGQQASFPWKQETEATVRTLGPGTQRMWSVEGHPSPLGAPGRLWGWP